MKMIRTIAAAVTGVALMGCAMPADQPEETADTTQDLVPAPPFAGDPANGAVFGVDVAMYQGPLAQAELDCFWDSGVRHLIVGTQVEEVAREQLAMAVSRGMTVDAYVYLNWYDDMRAQVAEAMRRVQGFPIGRMWLDVEDEHTRSYGYRTLVSMVRAGIDECKTHAGVECGIYTGPGFWRTFMNDTTELSDVPLWYARYNRKRMLSDWREDHFGGWQKAVGKQWVDEAMCHVGSDKNTIQPRGLPAVHVDRALPPDTGLPPPAPKGLYPANGAVVGIDQVKLMVQTIPRATHYELALERWNGTAFQTYTTWSTSDGFQSTYPNKGSIYRFKARAQNAHGWGPWSAPVVFDYGTYVGRRPAAATPP
jgi:GH25 family lysozyme M1 (1,4-beta-N-acetylmuramidase)